MVNFIDVVVVVNKNVFVRDNFGFGFVMDMYQNGVFVILICIEVVFCQCQIMDIVINEIGYFKMFFQSFYQFLVFYLNMWYVMNFVVVWVNKFWQDY